MVEDFGPYRIVRKIAVGGMAEIFLARQRGIEGLERTVVIKRILPSYSQNPEFVTMFLDEARLMAALSHPNIAQVFDLGKTDDSYYLVMERIRGPTLGALISAAHRAGAGALPEREALGIILNVAQALDYVHGLHDDLGRPLNIVHRDLNPANVLVDYTGAVKLIDFGIAKAATKVYETRAGVVKGTYGYIAPEQLTHSTIVDHRADVFALGVLSYEMCVGQHPFDTSDEPNLIDRILDAKYKRPRQVVPAFPKRLDRLIASCLAPHPEGRPADVRAMIDEVVGYLASRGVIPTMAGIAAVAHELVPDEEGAAPLKPLRSSQVSHPPFRTEHSRTAPLPRAPNGDADRISRPPGLAELLEGDEATVELGGRHLPRPGSAAGGERHRPIDPHGADEEAPTRVANLRGAGPEPQPAAGPAAFRSRAAPAVQPARAPRARNLEPTEMILDRTARTTSPWASLQRLLLLLGSVALVLGVGLAAFITARIIGDRPSTRPAPSATWPAPHDAEPADAPLERPPATEILVVSEPAGATIFVDGRDQARTTPATVALAAGTPSVFLRLSREGFVSQEREVQSTVGEARFVLSPLAQDAGPPDAGRRGKARRRRWRRRHRRPRSRRWM